MVEGGDAPDQGQTTQAETPETPQPRRRRSLDPIQQLKLADVVALSVVWATVLVITGGDTRHWLGSIAMSLCVVASGLWLLRHEGLYRPQMVSTRWVELSKLARVAALMAVAQFVILRTIKFDNSPTGIVVGAISSFVLLLAGRSFCRAKLASARRRGECVNDVFLLGANHEAVEFIELFEDHPEAGYRVVGVLGSKLEAIANGLAGRYIGKIEDAPALAREHEVTHVVALGGARQTADFAAVLSELQDNGVQIEMSTGMWGVDAKRIKVSTVAHEPLIYVERPTLSHLQVFAKRALDVVGAGLMIILLAPVMALVALGIKLNDRGPVLFRQKRVGQNGKTFQVLKFRTMCVDAEKKLAELQAQNERRGPLFKMERDPRVTRIGHILRESSLDELPQLFNVLSGTMSLVGPRPALPHEVEKFDDRLQERAKVRPGITGLWQVEARDNPSFRPYRRLDLFYVDNWSITLDLVILVGTVEQVITKLLKALKRSTPADAIADPAAA
jgi:exopolysaccharide biosynthesis polyprenyl glycosylphosphotransferase